ncbi:ABC-2 type transporter [Parelaphostrongylus tenuis]|uniref:ABC-2 type transporter n=1 Tax=Parelaphostrongylus tenuis TaxID=148309 RepID=A0AAD5LVX9_PARTN|nr:ABC-2 type transporter [Parelaphostrongylus tenuis]
MRTRYTRIRRIQNARTNATLWPPTDHLMIKCNAAGLSIAGIRTDDGVGDKKSERLQIQCLESKHDRANINDTLRMSRTPNSLQSSMNGIGLHRTSTAPFLNGTNYKDKCINVPKGGAGKTTLLNVLTSRNLSGLNVRGSVTIDGQRMNRWKLKEISAFVQQHDMFMGTMTAREHLQFTARLRMGSAYTDAEQRLRVDYVIRVILTCPKILFCDEPTSGLDAFMAGHVVASLRRLADDGMTVVITIHQPSSQVYLSLQRVCAVVTGVVYYDTIITPKTIISINGLLFHLVRSLNFMLQFPAVSAITLELPIVLRENSSGMYTSTAYFIGKNLAELPQYVILPIIYSTIVYSMAGLSSNTSTFFFAMIVSVLLTNVAISISYAAATIFGTTTVATAILPIFVVPMMAFGGFYITYESIPHYFTWLSTFSYFKYAYEGLAINEWETVDVIPGCLNHTGNYSNCPKSGSEVLESIDFDGISKWRDIVILSIMIVVIRLISYIALVVRAFYNR